VRAALAARLANEDVRQTRLVLAQALLRASDADPTGARALRDLLAGDDVPAVIAAAALARLGDEAALSRLDAALRDPRATHRRVAASALSWDAGDPDRARAALADDDAFVRVAVAGGVLASR
jgi:HEAT repeat protein